MEKDIRFQKILLNKETPDLSDDLEDRIMNSISKIATQNQKNIKSLLFAWFFFLVGLVFGVLISTVGLKSSIIIFGFDLLESGVIIQIICSLVILLLFERLYNLTKELRNRYIYVKTKPHHV
jgi:hypothetical protein